MTTGEMNRIHFCPDDRAGRCRYPDADCRHRGDHSESFSCFMLGACPKCGHAYPDKTPSDPRNLNGEAPE